MLPVFPSRAVDVLDLEVCEVGEIDGDEVEVQAWGHSFELEGKDPGADSLQSLNEELFLFGVSEILHEAKGTLMFSMRFWAYFSR